MPAVAPAGCDEAQLPRANPLPPATRYSTAVLGNAHLLFGLLAAMLYAFAAPCLKLATERGVSSLQTTLLANVAAAMFFTIAFLPWTGPRLVPEVWWPSLVVGALFFLGQIFTILALKHGHASIATPALGSKVVIVALLVTCLFHTSLHPNVLIAAIITSAGIVVLAYPSEHFPWAKIVPAVAFSLLAAASFGMFDVLTQRWSPWLSFGLLMPWALMFSTIVTIPFILSINRRWPRIPGEARLHLALGVGLLTLQSMIFVWAIAYFRDAAGLNVVYGSRGVWSVVIVWLLGHWFSQHERFHTRKQVIMRLVGATLIAIAVGLVFAPK